MFKNLLGKFSKDLGIDLGTASTLVYVKDKGIVINEPSVVAVNEKSNQLLAVGEEAKKMIGKTPSHITASRPLRDGVVSDFEVAEKMLKHFFDKVSKENVSSLPKPRVVIAIPLGVTEVEKKAVEDAALSAGARQVYLIEEPMAAAIGARLPVQDSTGNMVVDIGGGTTEIAVISLGGVVNSRSLRVAGDELNQDIVNYCREKFNILLGEKTAEEVKIRIGTAMNTPESDQVEGKIRGRDLITGLPKEIVVNSNHIREALNKTVGNIIENIKSTIETTPPELVADIYDRGICLSGGGALLKGLDERVKECLKIPVYIIDDPQTAVVRGSGIILDDLDNLKEMLTTTEDVPVPLANKG